MTWFEVCRYNCFCFCNFFFIKCQKTNQILYFNHRKTKCRKMVASNKQDKPKAQEAVITKKSTNQGEKKPKIVASPLPP